MQRWTLEQKVFHTIEVMQTFISRMGGTDKTYISFSGGVDSLVLLHIARKFIYKDFKAAFCNTGMEYPEMVRFVKKFSNVDIIHPKKHAKEIYETKGFPLVSKMTSQYIEEARRPNKDTNLYRLRMGNNRYFSIPKKWRFLVDKPYNTSDKCCHWLKKEPMRKYERETGRKPILGIMASESQMRQLTYVRNGGCNTFAEGKEKSMPLSIWMSEDVWNYIEHNHIEYCPIYDKLKDKRTGCVCCGYGVTLDPHKLDIL